MKLTLEALTAAMTSAVTAGIAADREAQAANAPTETDAERITREAAEAQARAATAPGAVPAATAVAVADPAAAAAAPAPVPTRIEAPRINGAANLPDGVVDARAGEDGTGRFTRYSPPEYFAPHKRGMPQFMVRRYAPGDQALAIHVINQARFLMVNNDPAGWARWLQEHRDLGGEAGAAGGFLVPDEFAADVIMKEGELSPFATSEFIRIVPMGRDTMNVPVLETRPTVGRFRENKPPGANQEPRWLRVELRARKFGEVLPLSNELLSDENIGVLQFLRDLYAEVLAETRNELVTNGTGADEPQGFRRDARIATFGFTGSQTASEDIIDWVNGLYWKLKAKERVNAVWTASSLMLETLDNIKDGEGRPLMGRLPESPFRTLKGRIVLENDSIPDDLGVGSDESELIYGNFKKYIFGDRQQMAFDTDTGGKFFENDQTAMKVTERYDGRVGQPDAFIIGTGKIVQ